MLVRYLCLFIVLISFLVNARSSDEYVPGELIIKLRDPSVEYTFLGAKEKRAFKILKDVRVIKFPHEVNLMDMVSRIEKDPNVIYAEPNYIIKVDTIDHKGATNASPLKVPFNPVAKYKDDTLIAIIDSGIDYKHRDLKNHIWVNEAEKLGSSGVDDDNNGYVDDIYGVDYAYDGNNPIDRAGHGTHIAGIALDAQNKDLNLKPLGRNIKVMSIKLLNDRLSGTIENAIRAIEYAVLHGAKVLNCSWSEYKRPNSLYDAFKMAEEKGVISAAAAGNGADDLDRKKRVFPANFDLDGIIAVASVEKNGERADYSGYGRTAVDIASYGSNIKSTLPGNRYGRKTGTSMATPLVSGTLAMMFAREPNLSLLEAKKRIINGAERLLTLRHKVVAQGKLNISNALRAHATSVPWPVYKESDWVRYDYEVSSEHPYPEGANIKYKIRHPGAKAIRVHFSVADLENRHDYLRIINPRGVLFDEIIYEFEDGVTSNEVDGDTLIINLISDDSYSYYGFDVDYYLVIE